MMNEKIIISSDTKRANRIPPGQHETKKWPVLHTGQGILVDKNKWSLKVFGLVSKEQTYNYDQFVNLPKVKVFSDIHCVTTWSKLNNWWEGVSSQTIADAAGVLPEARHVLIHSVGGYTTNLKLEEFLDVDVLFANKHDDKLLSAEHGFPVRLVVPKLYFWKSAKWVKAVEFLAEEKLGFWEADGYHHHGDPWEEERYSRL